MLQDLLLVTLPQGSTDSRPALLTAAMATAHDCWHLTAQCDSPRAVNPEERWSNLWSSMLDLLLGESNSFPVTTTTDNKTPTRKESNRVRPALLPTRITFGARSYACSALVDALSTATISQHGITGSNNSSSSNANSFKDGINNGVVECSDCLSVCAQLLKERFLQAAVTTTKESSEVPWASVSVTISHSHYSFVVFVVIAIIFVIIIVVFF